MLVTGARVKREVWMSGRATFADWADRRRGVRAKLAHGTSFLGDTWTGSSHEDPRAAGQREREILAPEAAKSGDTKGRPPPETKIRSGLPFSATAIASSTAGFRRLKHKRRCSSRRPAITTALD